MCAQFSLKVNVDEMKVKYGIKAPSGLHSIDERFLPYKAAPVIVKPKSSESLKLVSMNFSLVPSWSKEPKVKFATHNARIETITEKPTWKIPFQRLHCFVPMTTFYESVYEGPLAGNVIEFASENQDLLFAAGIFDHWSDPESDKKLFSFSILTSDPTKFISDHGHDRCPIFLNFENSKTWLTLNEEPKKMVNFLLQASQKPNLQVQVDRPRKAGWEKRK